MHYDVVYGRLPTIPEYYQQFINKNVDLEEEPKQPSPWRKEEKPSFSYSGAKGIWKDFGGSKQGGKVEDLHRVNYHLKDNEEALKSLKALYQVPEPKPETLEMVEIEINIAKVENEEVYQKALIKANNVERWLELDYVMSKVPLEILDLKNLVDKW